MIHIQQADFDIGYELSNLQNTDHDTGAVVSFTGVVRGQKNGEKLLAMELEHYPGMTEKQLKEIVQQAKTRWPLKDTLVIHRTGLLKPGENIVLVATSSAHRHAAFAATSYIMDFLKVNATFWKREIFADRSEWVEAKEQDQQCILDWEKNEK